jgi:hypothetical protein
VEQVDHSELLKRENRVSVTSKERSTQSHITSQVFLLAKDSVIALQLGFEGFECCFPYLSVVREAPGSEARAQAIVP